MAKSVDGLQHRLDSYPDLLETSSFYDQAAAERAATAVLRLRSAELAFVIANPPNRGRFAASLDEPAGIVLRRGSPPVDSGQVIVLADGDGDGRFLIRTGFLTLYPDDLAQTSPDLALLIIEFGQDYFDDYSDEQFAYNSTLLASDYAQRQRALAQLNDLDGRCGDEGALRESLVELGMTIVLREGRAPYRDFLGRLRTRLSNSLPH